MPEKYNRLEMRILKYPYYFGSYRKGEYNTKVKKLKIERKRINWPKIILSYCKGNKEMLNRKGAPREIENFVYRSKELGVYLTGTQRKVLKSNLEVLLSVPGEKLKEWYGKLNDEQ